MKDNIIRIYEPAPEPDMEQQIRNVRNYMWNEFKKRRDELGGKCSNHYGIGNIGMMDYRACVSILTAMLPDGDDEDYWMSEPVEHFPNSEQ